MKCPLLYIEEKRKWPERQTVKIMPIRQTKKQTERRIEKNIENNNNS